MGGRVLSAVVLLSGGLDSSTALGLLVRTDPEVTALSIDYGQRHVREVEAAEQVASHYGVPHRVIDLTGLLTGSALLGEVEVPEGRYDDESMSATVVPGRNLLFIATAVAYAAGHEMAEVVIAVHPGDHPIYPDCRPEFHGPLAEAVRAAYGVTLRTPFVYMPKDRIVVAGAAIGVPYDLTWSCYQGGEVHCGRCGTCVERIEAFMLAGVPDPTTYADPDYARSVL